MARDLIDQTGEKYALSDLHRLKAALAKADGDSEIAESQLNTALGIARQQGAKLWELRAAIELAKLRQEQGRTDEAVSLLRPAHDSINDEDCPADRAMAQELLTEMAG